MALTYRQTKGSALTIQELDANFQYFTGSQAITGSLIVTQAITASSLSGSFTGSFLGTSSYATQALSASYAPNSGATVSTASLLTTASATNNVITFTKGDASTFTVTVATGSTVSASYATSASYAISSSVAISSSYALSSSFTAVATSASYATQALSASYFSGSIGGATFTGDISFTSGSNVDGLFVVIPTSDLTGSVTGGIQVMRAETGSNSTKWTALNYQGGSGRLVAVDKNLDNPSLFIMLHDANNGINMMEFRTEPSSDVSSAYMVMNTAVLPTSEPSISGQLWVSGSAGASSKVLCIKN